MSRRGNGAAEAAAAAASEAARALQARQQELKQTEKPEPAPEPEAKRDDAPPRRELPARGNKVREAMFDEIRASRGEKEPKEEPAPEPKAEPKVEPQPENTTVAANEPTSEPVAAAPEVPEAPKTVRVKVDGEEFDAPAEEVEDAGGVKAYQILKASENRLKKANDALAEIRRLQAASAPKPEPEKPKEDITQFIASKMDIIRFGTPEEAAKAQIEISQRLAQPAVDPNQIISQAMAQIDHQAAVRKFDAENADLVTNPVILNAIVALRQTKMQKHQQEYPGTPIDWGKFYSTIAHEVRGAFGRQSQPAALPKATGGTPSQPASEKEARKASITNLPTAAARAELPKEEKQESREESLNRMRKARGLPLH